MKFEKLNLKKLKIIKIKINTKMSNPLFSYKCYRCENTFSQISNIKYHLNKRIKCNWKNEILTEDDNEVYTKSLEKVYKDVDLLKKIIEEKDEKKKKEKKDVKVKKDHVCDFCNKSFIQKFKLNVHLLSCKVKKAMEIEEAKSTNITTNIQIQNIGTQNLTKIDQLTQIENIHFKVDSDIVRDTMMKILIPFLDEFDISHISDETRIEIIVGNYYDKMLNKILENDRNLNYRIADESNIYVYEGEKLGYIPMDRKMVFQKLCEKIKDSMMKILTEYCEERKMEMDVKKDDYCFFRWAKYHIGKKHKNYEKEDPEIEKELEDLITKMTLPHKEKIESLYHERQEMLNDYEEAIFLCDQLKSVHEKKIKADETTPVKAIEFAIKVEEKIQEGVKTITKSISSVNHYDTEKDRVEPTPEYNFMKTLMMNVRRK